MLLLIFSLYENIEKDAEEKRSAAILAEWTFLGRNVLPYEVDQTIRNQFPSTGWSSSLPQRYKYQGEWVYWFLREEEPWQVVIQQDGKVLSAEEAEIRCSRRTYI